MSSRAHTLHGAVALIVLASTSLTAGASEHQELYLQPSGANVAALVVDHVGLEAVLRDLLLGGEAGTTLEGNLHVSDVAAAAPTVGSAAYRTVFDGPALGADTAAFPMIELQRSNSTTLGDVGEATRLPSSLEVSAATGYGPPESGDRESRIVNRPSAVALVSSLDGGYDDRFTAFLASAQD